MALKGRGETPETGKTPSQDAAAERARQVFAKLNQAENRPPATETLAFRVPYGERERLRLLFARNGMTLTAGLKAAVYAYAKELEK